MDYFVAKHIFIYALNIMFGFTLGWVLMELHLTKKKNIELIKKLEDEKHRNRKRKSFLGP